MDQPDRKNIENIILRLMEDESITSSEAIFLKDWIKDNPAEAEELYSLSLLWTKLDTCREIDDKTLLDKWNETQKKISKRKNRSVNLLLQSYKKYVAVFIIGALIPSMFIAYKGIYENKKLLSQVISVPYGAKSTINLPDGSEIILNAGSRISYDGEYGKKTRSITLKGEAFFVVAKNKKKPFIVHTKYLSVKAYGTKFNIKCYDNDNSVETTLIEGLVGIKIKKDRNRKEYMLQPNEQLIFNYKKGNDKRENIVKLKNINTKLYTSWIHDKIQVKSVTLIELAVKLQRKYNVTIHIEDEGLENMKFTGVLENETIEQILQALELSAKIKYRIDEREIWLYK